MASQKPFDKNRFVKNIFVTPLENPFVKMDFSILLYNPLIDIWATVIGT